MMFSNQLAYTKIVFICIQMFLKLVLKSPIQNNQHFFPKMTWRIKGNIRLFQPMKA